LRHPKPRGLIFFSLDFHPVQIFLTAEIRAEKFHLKITFESLLQDSQDYATFEQSDAHVVSVIRFSMDIAGKQFGGLSVEVRQPYGTDFESEPLEVSRVSGGYRGPWNHSGFAELAERYYRSFIGLSGRGIRIQGGSNIRMRNNMFVSRQEAQLDIPDELGGAW
jgi:hypothetical protein